VTLCGLFIYRGLANWLALPDPLAPVRGLARFLSFGYLFSGASVQTGSASNVGIGARSQEVSDLVFLSTGYWHGVPVRLLLFLAIAALAAVFLHWSVYGRYLYAIGSNEQAARYAGVATNRYKVLAYVLCSVLAAVGGMLELLDLKSAAPSNTGSWYELYAITGAVLGGCSLRGGDGTVIGMILGTAVLPLLRNLCNLSAIPSDLEFTVIGLALLAGTIVDEVLKRRAARKG
jgi:ribose transport system permease protein